MAQKAGHRYREVPCASHGIAAIWTYERGTAVHSLIPADGSIDLIVRIGRTAMDACVHEPTVTAHAAFIPNDAQIWGVRLLPGHGGPLLASAATLIERVAQHVERGCGPQDLAALVAEELEEHGRPPALIRDFVALANESRGLVRLSGPGSAFANERALQRAAREWLRMTPKTFLRIQRAGAAREAIERGGHLGTVASEFGYADQAHLTREIQELLGLTPGKLQAVGILQDAAVRDG